MSDDSNLWVKFEKRPVHMKAKSEKEGRPIYEDRDFISIIVPGSVDEVVREVREDDKTRFSVQWSRYQSNQEQTVDGTRIEEWAALTRSQVEELKFLKVFTVEQMASLSDAQCQKLGAGYMSLRTKAVAYLAQAQDTAAIQKYAAENERLRKDLDDLKAVVAELQAKKGRAA